MMPLPRYPGARFACAGSLLLLTACVGLREISSRSGSESRSVDRGVVRGFTPPILRSRRCTDLAEQPTALAAASYVSPARTRC